LPFASLAVLEVSIPEGRKDVTRHPDSSYEEPCKSYASALVVSGFVIATKGKLGKV
jgi:hypothetical protein